MEEINLNSYDETTTYDMSQVAKITGKVGRNNLYEILRKKNILASSNEPYQEYMNQGLFKVTKHRSKSKSGLYTQINLVTLVTEKGLTYITKLLNDPSVLDLLNEDEDRYSWRYNNI